MIDSVAAGLFIVLLLASMFRKGKRPTWAKLTVLIAAAVYVGVAIAATVSALDYGDRISHWVFRLGYSPAIVV
jgi:hypothetical protein